MEEKGRARRLAIQELSTEIQNLHLLHEQPPLHLLDPLLEGLAKEELEKIAPAVLQLQNVVALATKESADRVALKIEELIAPTLGKSKSIRVRAHSLGYNGR